MKRIIKHISFHFHSLIWSWHNSKLSVSEGTQAASSTKL